MSPNSSRKSPTALSQLAGEAGSTDEEQGEPPADGSEGTDNQQKVHGQKYLAEIYRLSGGGTGQRLALTVKNGDPGCSGFPQPFVSS